MAQRQGSLTAQQYEIMQTVWDAWPGGAAATEICQQILRPPRRYPHNGDQPGRTSSQTGLAGAPAGG